MRRAKQLKSESRVGTCTFPLVLSHPTTWRPAAGRTLLELLFQKADTLDKDDNAPVGRYIKRGVAGKGVV